MAIFRLVNNVPDAYTTTSRDFQMLCNLFDAMNQGVKYDIDTLPTVNDTRFIRDILLPKLSTKLGFRPNIEIPTEVLRLLLISYPYFIKYKGSARGIRETALTFLKSQGINGAVEVEVFNTETIHEPYQDTSHSFITYLIKLNLESDVINLDILDEVFRYILPTGYIVRYVFENTPNIETTNVVLKDSKGSEVVSSYKTLSSLNHIATEIDTEEYPNVGIQELTTLIQEVNGDGSN